MPNSWKLTAFADKSAVENALLAHEDACDWDHDMVLSGCEIDAQMPNDWKLEAWLPRRPRQADKTAIRRLFAVNPPELQTEELEDQDWLTLSQHGVEPINAGRFYVHTPEYPASTEPGFTSLTIPASQAFGTGQHETTAGCLAMLTLMKRTGVTARNIADIGTGTGLLAFAALDLWPSALATASDIDPVCTQVVENNAAANIFTMGHRAGELTMVVADGMNDPLLQARGPYDLLIANILAGPLVELAPDFAVSVPPSGHVLLAGLLTEQEPSVRRAYRKAGFRLAKRLVNGDWSILWLRKR
ncbi:50S ribosomal protein L11 methyltransferase [Pontixanthobacter aestiaquae]|uniref:Ribosomal protein L11 methyltransferase n=1 Tax=Pontixanthobacter aestiaquae TaxID=1509367 RepID=A0A844ZA92_9SPHN|nr:50S ribosomal protein L11 methyltransferase [Pontixanthobacter aestiaquae]MDN3645218.1 50S ribosomal protein L11 methyltransferase [Pontixanthobacter aestiaquae]MXO83780.1 methyltransferase [Pontixanthobacter aestiaquae]